MAPYWIPSLFPFLIPITAIICTFVYLTKRLQVRTASARREHDAAQARRIEKLEERLAARETHVERLEERIRVLERIVTDEAKKLGDEIERLRA